MPTPEFGSVEFDKYFKYSTIDHWKRNTKYHNSFLIPKDKVLEAGLKNSIEKGLPQIAVNSAQGNFQNLLLKSIGAK